MSEVAVMPLEDYKNACNSIRAKTGKTDLITSGQLSTEIDSIEKGYDTSDATTPTNEVRKGKIFYNKDGKQTGTMPEISFASEITPKTVGIVIPCNAYVNGNVTVKGDANLKPENIVEGVSIFGVDGTVKGSFYDDFWDAYQKKGERTDYISAFSKEVWSIASFKPKYSMRPLLADSMFNAFNGKGIDMVDYLEELGVTLDLSLCTQCNTFARDSIGITRWGVMDFRNCNTVNMVFYRSSGISSGLKKIDKFMYKDYAPLSMSFVLQDELTSVEFVGKIGKATQNLSYSPFDAPTVRSIIGCLENYAGTENEFAYTLKLSETAWNNVNADTQNPPLSGNTWEDYVNSLGWLTA